MRKFVLIAATLLVLLSGCMTESKYHLLGVEFDIQVTEVTRGYIHAYFYPSKVAYYVTGCMPVNDDYDPVDKADQFMTLMVDSLYIDYLNWRYDYLRNQEDFVADFASHSLQYGDSEKYFQNLQPDTDYWVYAFVVDPGTKEPFDMLWLQEVHTDSLSVNRIWFDTRVQGSYFYMYPRDKEGGEILEHYPYTGGIVDAIDLLEAVPLLGITTEQRLDRYSEKTYQLAVEYDILSGITYTGVKQINYSGRFKPGHIYYIILGELQGGIVNRAYYRFVYNPADHTQEVALIWRDPYWTETPDEVGDD
ncbi:MAG: hypothetical protein K5909_00295 [Bacteroidales bacterium]|nr:hypothetical protein [Bacteroidales bacterium]